MFSYGTFFWSCAWFTETEQRILNMVPHFGLNMEKKFRRFRVCEKSLHIQPVLPKLQSTTANCLFCLRQATSK